MPDLNTIHQGDVLDTLRLWPSAFVHCAVTSPPYWGLRDYGVAGQLGLEKTPEEFVAKMVDVFREVRRVLRDDGTLWLNIGDCYNSAASSKGTRPGSSRADGKVKTESPRNRNGVNAPGLKPKDLVGIPWMLAFALRADGWYLRQDIVWAKPNPMPESVSDRCTKAHEYVFLLSKSRDYYFDQDAIAEPATYQPDHATPAGWASGTHPHTAVAHNRKPRRAQPKGSFKGKTGEKAFRAIVPTRNKRSVWTVSTQQFPDAHFATFPEKLIEPCILAGAPPQGVVLDPFMGAGTTALVAARLNRRFVGIELNPAYIEIARRRIEHEVAQQKFF